MNCDRVQQAEGCEVVAVGAPPFTKLLMFGRSIMKQNVWFEGLNLNLLFIDQFYLGDCFSDLTVEGWEVMLLGRSFLKLRESRESPSNFLCDESMWASFESTCLEGDSEKLAESVGSLFSTLRDRGIPPSTVDDMCYLEMFIWKPIGKQHPPLSLRMSSDVFFERWDILDLN